MGIDRTGGERKSRTSTRIIVVGFCLCLAVWVALAESRLLPDRMTREVQVYFEWESQQGFKVFRVEKPAKISANRACEYLIAIQIKPRLIKYFRSSGWQKINGRVGLEVANVIPVAVPVGLGSGGDLLYDPDESPLMHAADKGDTEEVQRLLHSGANVNEKDQRGQTPLIHACLRGNASPELINTLLRAGADVDAKDRHGRTPLFLAVQSPPVNGARRQQMGVVTALLGAHADVNAKDANGDTALMMAASYADAETVGVLLSKGADPDARNRRGETALSIAEAKGNTKIIQVLRHATRNS